MRRPATSRRRPTFELRTRQLDVSKAPSRTPVPSLAAKEAELKRPKVSGPSKTQKKGKEGGPKADKKPSRASKPRRSSKPRQSSTSRRASTSQVAAHPKFPNPRNMRRIRTVRSCSSCDKCDNLRWVAPVIILIAFVQLITFFVVIRLLLTKRV